MIKLGVSSELKIQIHLWRLITDMIENTLRACGSAKVKPVFHPRRAFKTGRSEQPHTVTKGCRVRRSSAHSICFQRNFLLTCRGGSAGRGPHPGRNGQTDGRHSCFPLHAREELGPGLRGSPMEGPVWRLFPHLSCRSLSESFVKYHHLAFALLWGMKGWALFHAGEEVVRGREPQSGEAGGKMVSRALQESRAAGRTDGGWGGERRPGGLREVGGLPGVPGYTEGVES